MFARVHCLSLLMLCVALLASCSRRPPRIYPPEFNPSKAAADAMAQYDADGNGSIADQELEKAPALKYAIGRIDANGDGAIVAKEIANLVQAWMDSDLGRRSVDCIVTRRGTPLTGATVTLDPEPFLGDKLQPATGVSDERGEVALSIPVSPEEPPGVAPGLYLVRITKVGEEIPAKYNTNTIFGYEVADDPYEGTDEEVPVYDIE